LYHFFFYYQKLRCKKDSSNIHHNLSTVKEKVWKTMKFLFIYLFIFWWQKFSSFCEKIILKLLQIIPCFLKTKKSPKIITTTLTTWKGAWDLYNFLFFILSNLVKKFLWMIVNWAPSQTWNTNTFSSHLSRQPQNKAVVAIVASRGRNEALEGKSWCILEGTSRSWISLLPIVEEEWYAHFTLGVKAKMFNSNQAFLLVQK
jgi:hypothetical protein